MNYMGYIVSRQHDGDGSRVKSIINGVTTIFVGNYYEVSGSTSITANSNGALVSELRYKPWGETRYSNGTTPTKYTYMGQYSNVSDFGLYFYNARWYDPALGRFAQADSIVPGGVQGLDRYAYANNSPVRYTDPSGHCPEEMASCRKTLSDLLPKPRCSNCHTRPVGRVPTATPTPTLETVWSAASTSTPTPGYNCTYGPTNGCATATAFASPTATPTYIPIPFGIPATPLSDRFKTGISAGFPDITGKPNQILNPGYSAAISDSMTELEIYIKLVGGWGVSNAPHITDYLYGTQLAKDVLNKWMNFTGNNNLIIPPLPLPYLLNNSPSLPSWEPHYD
jgi:RHS repeat-associated protein